MADQHQSCANQSCPRKRNIKSWQKRGQKQVAVQLSGCNLTMLWSFFYLSYLKDHRCPQHVKGDKGGRERVRQVARSDGGKTR